MKILLLDNYDSFTYNLKHGLRLLGLENIDVLRNDKISLKEVAAYDRIVLSPGPGIPKEAGIMPELVRHYATQKPILGVCLGHQCIGEVFGGSLTNVGKPLHGKATPAKVIDSSETLFSDLGQDLLVGRYHSWVVERSTLPKDLLVTAEDEAGYIMALRHKTLPIKGVQFHPESVLTPLGQKMLENWVRL